MKTLDEQMSIYAAYHRHPWNRATHFIGVPLIIFAILIPMGWVRFSVGGLDLSLAHVFVAVVLAYYFALDVALALAMTVFIALMLWASESVARASLVAGLWTFAITFVLGWIIQLIGHYFEGRRPALVDNLFQIFVAPIFLMAEVFFALGAKRDVHAKVEALVRDRLSTN